jgi:nucleotide-binding universal stress UspA family protein
MYKNIIVAMALDHGIGASTINIARMLLDEGGHITAIHVSEPMHSSASAMIGEEMIEKAFQNARDHLAQRVAESPDIQTVALKGNPGQSISDYAKEIGADCIVVGSHKPGLSDYFLGSTAARIVRHAPCSVHVVR